MLITFNYNKVTFIVYIKSKVWTYSDAVRD